MGGEKMSLFGCENRFSCTVFAVVASLIIGIITAFLQITAVITLAPAFLWVVLGIAVIYLAVTLLAAALTNRASPCAGTTLSVLLAGILGSILFSVILLGVGFAATSVVGAIFAGILLFFFSLTIIGTACLVRCLFRTNG